MRLAVFDVPHFFTPYILYISTQIIAERCSIRFSVSVGTAHRVEYPVHAHSKLLKGQHPPPLKT